MVRLAAGTAGHRRHPRAERGSVPAAGAADQHRRPHGARRVAVLHHRLRDRHPAARRAVPAAPLGEADRGRDHRRVRFTGGRVPRRRTEIGVSVTNPDPQRYDAALEYDAVIESIAAYVCDPDAASSEAARSTAHLSLIDALAAGLLGLADPDCVRIVAPPVPITTEHPARVLGTRHTADPVTAAFGTGTAIRWLDYNDTWLALEWGHPSDNLGGILAVADHLAAKARTEGGSGPSVDDVLTAMIQAHEIQGVLALGTAFNRAGLDHVLLVRVATAAVVTRMLGGGVEDVRRAVAHAWADGGALRVYRHAPNVTWRKSWAAGDATARGVRLAQLALAGAEAPRTPLTTPGWGVQDALLGGHEVTLERGLGTYIMENVLLKPWFPAEYHGQTAVEAALALHPRIKDRLGAITKVEIRAQEAAVRIIDKTGPLRNPADRDHSIQYMVAAALLFGELDETHYHDSAAADPGLRRLIDATTVTEDPEYSAAYLDPERRAVPGAVRVHDADGPIGDWAEVLYPVGHPRRRAEAVPHVRTKLHRALTAFYGGTGAAPPSRVEETLGRLTDRESLAEAGAADLLGLLTPDPR
ncbi:MAG: bifunctional 2-methylcitrate dehydratase/aconitate hydratase [Streptosporangiales bacterium]|nr:bifunctional 2-methylcitrate dehydratase/aconitate hydratase [Streptosporangiales bacterium]